MASRDDDQPITTKPHRMAQSVASDKKKIRESHQPETTTEILLRHTTVATTTTTTTAEWYQVVGDVIKRQRVKLTKVTIAIFWPDAAGFY